MSFRRDKEKALRWQNWLQQHRDELLACGIPRVVLEEMGHWYYFLEHGYFTPVGSAEPIVDVDQMSRADAPPFPGCPTDMTHTQGCRSRCAGIGNPGLRCVTLSA